MSEKITKEMIVGDIVADNFNRAKVFEHLGIDSLPSATKNWIQHHSEWTCGAEANPCPSLDLSFPICKMQERDHLYLKVFQILGQGPWRARCPLP